jgi:hypothetical protein
MLHCTYSNDANHDVPTCYFNVFFYILIIILTQPNKPTRYTHTLEYAPHVYTHTYARAHTHTHTHIYIYIYIYI